MSSVAEAMTEREERFSTVYGTEDVLDVVMVLIATERHREGLKIPECPHGNRAGRCLPPPPPTAHCLPQGQSGICRPSQRRSDPKQVIDNLWPQSPCLQNGRGGGEREEVAHRDFVRSKRDNAVRQRGLESLPNERSAAARSLRRPGGVRAGRPWPGARFRPQPIHQLPTCAPWGSSTPGGRAPASLVVKWVERGSGRSFPCRSQGH